MDLVQRPQRMLDPVLADSPLPGASEAERLVCQPPTVRAFRRQRTPSGTTSAVTTDSRLPSTCLTRSRPPSIPGRADIAAHRDPHVRLVVADAGDPDDGHLGTNSRMKTIPRSSPART